MTTNTDPVRALTTVRFLDGGVVQMDRTDYDRLSALASAPPSAPVGVDVMSIIDKWMAGYDHWGAGCEKSADASEKEWARDRKLISETLSQQPASDKFIATFRCEGNGIVGTTPAKIHGVTQHDDGCIEVVIDHWPQQPAAPSGEAVGDWVTVPREPTDAMLDAMHRRIRILCNPAERTADIQNDAEVWGAMLAAAPPQPAGVDGVTVDVLRIPAQPGLDPIVVYFEDYSPGRGRATVACYGDAWTAAWGAMGDRTVREFVSSVDPHYLAGSMEETTRTTKGRRKYAERIAKAVIAALAAQQQGEPACRHVYVRDEDNGGECCQRCGHVRTAQQQGGRADGWR